MNSPKVESQTFAVILQALLALVLMADGSIAQSRPEAATRILHGAARPPTRFVVPTVAEPKYFAQNIQWGVVTDTSGTI